MILGSSLPGNASEEPKRVLIVDACDPASFNLAIGPGTCVGNGDVTFAEFIAALQEDRTIDEWAFDPNQLKVVAGTPVVVKNIGGETHTFTRVAAFGPGFVPPLNLLVFGVAGPPIPEFNPPGPRANFVSPGGTLTLTTGAGKQLSLGKNLVQCGIHPWMRTVITVMSSD
jgi:hypothetical protein